MGDYSCYLTIQNQTGHQLAVAPAPPQWGSWINPPQPQQPIPAGASVSFQLKDGWGAAGSEGSFTAQPTDSQAQLRASFQDGYVQSNYCNLSRDNIAATMSWTFTGASGSPNNPQQGSVPSGGHPVYLVFTFKDTASPPPAPPGPTPPRMGAERKGGTKDGTRGTKA